MVSHWINIVKFLHALQTIDVHYTNMSFINKVVIVTGAASGIGEAIALNFAKLSARLALIDINPDNLSKVAEQCENLSKTKVFKAVADVSKDEDLKEAVDNIIKEYGKIDVLINCAGISGDKGILDSGLLSVFDSVINVNLRSMVAMAHFTAASLIESKGCIINIGSIMGRMACKGAIPYNVSKAGVIHLTKNVALELADKGVRVNCILPGSVRTNFLLNAGRTQEQSDKILELTAKCVPLQRNVSVEEIADMAAYLASDKAKSITGAIFTIDAGFMLSGMPSVPAKKSE